MPDPTLRFAAGSPERPRSAVWRLWVHGSDAYLGARVMLSVYKLSMHKSGKWISAFTKESGTVLQDASSRRHHVWQRPSEFTSGWTLGPVVGIPWVTWRDELEPREEIPSDTVWVPGPKRNKKLQFIVLFSSAAVASDGILQVSMPADRIVGSLPMSNGETVWLQARQTEMSPEENKGIDSAEREFRGFGVSGDLESVHAWGLWIATSNPDTPILVQFPLGRRHFKGTPAGSPRTP